MTQAPVVFRTTAMPNVPRARVVSDISAFFGLTNADIIAVDEDVKAGELYNLCSTLVGDEPHLPLFGCDLPKRVFEPITAALLQQMTQDVYLQSKTWLPDIEVLTGLCKALALPANRLAGLIVGYRFAGDTWHLPVFLTSIASDHA